MRTGLALALVALCLAGGAARAERGHARYREMTERDQLRRMKAFIDAAYSCKRRGTPLLRIERTAPGEAPPTQLVMYRGGAVQFVEGDVTLWGCVERRVNDWVRWRLANVSWRAKGSGDCTSSAVTTRFTVAGRERFIECDGGKALAPKARGRLIEIEATLLSAARKGS